MNVLLFGAVEWLKLTAHDAGHHFCVLIAVFRVPIFPAKPIGYQEDRATPQLCCEGLAVERPVADGHSNWGQLPVGHEWQQPAVYRK